MRSDDAEALLNLKSSIDPLNSLQWPQGSQFCDWPGIKECMRGRVTKLVLEYLNLTGTLEEDILNRLDQLRVLSFKGNSLSGQIPNLSGLVNLKSLFLNNNNFSSEFPESITILHRVKIVVLSGNQLTGQIPENILMLRRLYVLYLQDNRLTGEIPPLNQTSLRFLNVSNNQLSGEIPITPALVRFNGSSFSGNLDLCGEQLGKQCNKNPNIDGFGGPSISPANPNPSRNRKKRSKLIKIIAGTLGGFVALLICILLLVACKRRGRRSGEVRRSKGLVGVEGGGAAEVGEGSRGSMGSTYKAVMESGFIVTVKRLKDARYPRVEEFRRQMEVLGRLRHPNLVPLRAYFQAKEERLLVYDYFPNGSLFSLIHGSRTSGGGKPLHWTSCLKIAEDLATGLLYIHQSAGLPHGNIKSSNVLLGSEFESCLTDYGLTAFRDPDSLEEPGASSLFYRAPECRDVRKPLTQQADVYSFGVLLLELLTGKTPFQDLVQEHGSDIPKWVKSVREEETESGDDPSSGNETSEEKLGALLNISIACVSLLPENRPAMREVLKMIRDTRAEAQVSSNSSDHSPGRWSDTVQSLPRDEHLSI